MSTASQVEHLYKTVVEDVINNVKDAFLDESVDEQVLQELKQLWESKLKASKAMEPAPVEQENVAIPQTVTMVLPQPIQTSLAASQGAQAAPQYQLSSAAATATLALPSGLFQQQLTALGAGGQVQNITVQQTGNGQYITLAGLPQHLPQFQQQLQQQQQQQQQRVQQPQMTHQQLTTQLLQQQQIRLPQQQQPQQQIRLTQQQLQQLQQQQSQQQPKLLIQNQTTLPSQVNKSQGGIHKSVIQLDGNGGSSSSDDDDFDDDDDKDEDREEENEEEAQGEEEDPLNSADDVSEEDPNELFDTDNVVVCQYDKINRNKNKWKFHLKDGIMNLNGRDFVFQKATGDSEW